MKCEICGKGIPEGATLFRQNEKGEIGIWRCEEHNKIPLPESEAQLIAAIQLDSYEQSQ